MISPRKTTILVLACIFIGLIKPVYAEQQVFRWKFATLAPDGFGWANHVKNHFIKKIDEVTGGNVMTTVYWGGIAGDDSDYLKKMRLGQIQGAGLSAQGATMACPEMTVLELPFMFQDYNEVDYVKAKMLPTFTSLLEQKGFFLLSWMDQDFDQIYSVNYPTATLDDFRKCNFINWYGPLEKELFRVLDIQSKKVDVPRIPKATQLGIVDGGIAPAIWMMALKMYSEFKYVNPIKIRYSPALIVLRIEDWKALPESYQKEILKVREQLTRDLCRGVRDDNEQALQSMIQMGMQPVSMKPEDLEKVKIESMKIWNNLSGRLFPEELLRELLHHLNAYRAQKGSSR